LNDLSSTVFVPVTWQTFCVTAAVGVTWAAGEQAPSTKEANISPLASVRTVCFIGFRSIHNREAGVTGIITEN
jgi:hypothetical protein